MKAELEKRINEILKGLGVSEPKAAIERPEDSAHGDYASNAALVCAKELKMKPSELASKLAEALREAGIPDVESVDIAGPGFVNFRLSKKFYADSIREIANAGINFGRTSESAGQKVLIEYTDPNPFKQFHIGHLMSNSIGESLSRLLEWNGAEVIRACYQGDIGLHVAKAMWGILKFKEEMPKADATLSEQVAFLGRAYVEGSNKYEDDQAAKAEIDKLNRTIFERSDDEINRLYEWGRKVSLDHFDEIYKKLGTRFDHFFFESEMAAPGVFIVEELLGKGIMKKSDMPGENGGAAIIFPGEEYGLHTRVFINSQGLPTYEAKELALNKKKKEAIRPDRSIVITAAEQKDYFKVVLKALEFVDSGIANKTEHISHGMLRFASGKMSSRKGNVITGESLMQAVENLVAEKVKDRELSEEEKRDISEKVGVGAIKYSILKQSIGKDIIYDFEKSLSFEGDSGPYLQYAHTRAVSVLAKAKTEGILPEAGKEGEGNVVERALIHFPEVTERAAKERAPQLIANYLIELAGAFNGYYAGNIIVDKKDKERSAHRVALTEAFAAVMKSGLWLLGIPAPEKM